MDAPARNRQIRSLVTGDGRLELRLESLPLPEPGPDEIVVRIEAAPINPSDLALLFGPADMSAATVTGSGDAAVVSAPIPEALRPMVAGREGEPMPVGNEAAGVVVAAGGSDQAQALMGRTVAIAGGEMFADYRCINAAMAMPMAEGVTPREAASSFVNPMTALGMTETMREEGFKGLVHTAAASNLGQMLNRICLADGIPLVNVVRKEEQVELLRAQGAARVLNSGDPDFRERLADAVVETGAYLCFDATGGGRLANTVLTAMEAAATRGMEYSRYGSDTLKKVYVYGRLDLSPMELTAAYGFAFSVSGWLLTPFLQRIGFERMRELQARVSREIRTTFASHYAAEIPLADVLSPEAMQVFGQRRTGLKYLINPTL